MRNKSPKYSLFYRSVWLAMALFMVVFCGPAKRVMELHFDKYATQQSLQKKLKTWYRDKRHSNPFVHVNNHHAPDNDGLVLFLVPLIFLLFLYERKIRTAYYQYSANGDPGQGIPLYLYQRNLRI